MLVRGSEGRGQLIARHYGKRSPVLAGARPGLGWNRAGATCTDRSQRSLGVGLQNAVIGMPAGKESGDIQFLGLFTEVGCEHLE